MEDKLSVNFEGKDRDIFMSYGLLNELAKIVGGLEQVASISLHDGLREEVLVAALAERKRSGKIEKAVADPDDLDLSINDAERIIDWVAGHLMSFFVRSLEKLAKLTEDNKDAIEGLKSSLDGLQASPSATA